MEDNRIHIAIQSSELDPMRVYRFVTNPQCGGINQFIGTVRNHNKNKKVSHLEFECYEPMAKSEMMKIAQACLEQFNVYKVAIEHRTGHLNIGEIAVSIAVSCPHRVNAFKACQFAIDQLKLHVPIWKKEFLSDGSYWVNSRP